MQHVEETHTPPEDLGETVPLSREYAAREQAPIVTHVAPRIFTEMECDWHSSHAVR